MIRIENLRKEFDKGVVALDDINLTIEEGSFIALLGPSGCGKTTTLNCVAGLLEPTSGAIYFDDKDVTDLAPKDRNIGMVFQSYALYPHMKVIDNIAFSLKQKGMPKAERHEKARQMARTLQIEHLLDRMPGELSGGQQQRVSMARALVKEPKVLLLDEPMSNLDARLKIEIRDEIRRIQQKLHVTSIIVTHDQEEAMAMADKIAILDNGRIQQYDTPEMLYHKPANLFVAHFMGNPPMNFIQARVAAGEAGGRADGGRLYRAGGCRHGGKADRDRRQGSGHRCAQPPDGGAVGPGGGYAGAAGLAGGEPGQGHHALGEHRRGPGAGHRAGELRGQLRPAAGSAGAGGQGIPAAAGRVQCL